MLFNVLYMANISPEQAVLLFVIMLVAYVLSVTIHEYAHAFAAYKMGDATPKLSGRLTLNPFKHMQLSGFLLFLVFGIGWASPVPINPINFKKYRKGIKWVSIAGVLANFILGLICAIIYAILKAAVGTPNTAMSILYMVLMCFMSVNSMLIMFNILPIYPLDGFNFITAFMKSTNKFIHYVIKNGLKIILTILVVDLVLSLFFGFELINTYLSLIDTFIFGPIRNLGV